MTEYLYDSMVLDFDGTLIDSCQIKTWAFGKLYEPYGKDIVEQVVAYHLQHEGLSRFSKFRYWKETLIGEPYSEEEGVEFSNNYSELVRDAVIDAPFFPTVLKFLEENYKKLPLFLASATPEDELREIVVRRGMDRFFQGVYGSPACKAKILNETLRKNKLVPECVLMLGDALSDLEAALSVGTKFIGILNGKTSPFPKNVTVVQHLGELKNLIKKSYEKNV